MFDARPHSKNIEPASDRKFGLTFLVVFMLIGLWPAIRGASFRWWALAVAIGFGAIALIAPWILRPLNSLWFRFGMMLNAIVSPVVLGFIFIVVIAPIGLLLRLIGKDVLDIGGQNRHKASYWIPREKIPTSDSMRDQF